MRDEGLLESALARPQNLFAYGESDAAALAGAYAFGIARNHPFIDGNKRTGFVATELFLALNGCELVADDAAYGKGLAEPLAALVAGMQGFGHILAPATASAKNLMPRVAALRDVMVISDVTGVVDADTFERPIYAGNAIQTVRSADAVKVATVRTAGFEATGVGGSAPVEPVAAADSGIGTWSSAGANDRQ